MTSHKVRKKKRRISQESKSKSALRRTNQLFYPLIVFTHTHISSSAHHRWMRVIQIVVFSRWKTALNRRLTDWQTVVITCVPPQLHKRRQSSLFTHRVLRCVRIYVAIDFVFGRTHCQLTDQKRIRVWILLPHELRHHFDSLNSLARNCPTAKQFNFSCSSI